jgi:putative protease
MNFEGQGFFPMGGLNKLRRDGIQELNEKRELLNFRSEITDEEYGEKLEKLMSFNKPKSKKQRMSVRVSSIDQFKHINLNKLDRIYIGFSEDIEDIFKEIKKSGKEGFLYTDKIVGEEGLKDLGKNIELLQGLIDGVSVSNIGTLKYVQKYNIDIHGDIGLNVFNSLTAKLLKDSGVKSITLSPELDIKGIDEICRRSSLDFELSVYGYYPLMVLKHCPMALIKKCDNDKSCSNCRFKRGYGLKDRKGKIFQMIRNNKVTEIYNTVPLMLSEEVGGIFKSGVNMIRVDFTVEKENISRIQDAFFSISKNLTDKEDVLHTIADLKRNGITKGHLHRGIL